MCVMLMTSTYAAPSNSYQAELEEWSSYTNSFSTWELSGLQRLNTGALQLDPATAQAGRDPYPAGGYHNRNYYNGGDFIVGEAISPVLSTSFGYQGAIASWNVETPPGTWIETLIRSETRGHWSKWYNLGIWAADTSTIERHSVDDQNDADADIYTDLLVLKDNPQGSRTYQLAVRAFATTPAITPTIHRMAVTLSTVPEKPQQLHSGDPTLWGHVLQLPECSQMVYPDGGEVWCSPTSLSMVLSYWHREQGPCEPKVRSAVNGVYDWVYDGHGNWSFNTAFAAAQGFEATVARFTSMAQVEPWIVAGVPVVISFGWEKGDLQGAELDRSSGHLAVIVGFDAQGNPVVNDPAAQRDQDVKRTYNRQELETLWLEYSGGTVYLVYPRSQQVPALT